MIARTPALCALTIGLSVLTLSAPASAAAPAPGALAAQARAVAASAPVTAAGAPLAAIRVRSDVSTAYAGRYAKFLSSFRCERGRHYQIHAAVSQSRGDDVLAAAYTEDRGLVGECTGRTQRRMVYLAAGPVDEDGGGSVSALRSGRGEAVVFLATTATRRSERMRFDAAALATVRVAPR